MSSSTPRTLSSDDIPVIDISALLDDSDPLSVGEKLAWAATEVGFIYVSNHGIADEVLAHAHATGLAFFRKPLERKLEVKSNIHHHGYLRPGATKMYDDAAVDIKESFNFGLELSPEALIEHRDNRLLGANCWPEFMPELRAALYPFFESASRCAEALLGGFALAAGHPKDTFTHSSDLAVSRGSMQYYPGRSDDLPRDRFNLAPHTDFGVLTVLAQDDVGGLQIQGLDGDWVAVPPINGTVVVNVGDLLSRWSNGHYRSTPHRVLNQSQRERLSLVLAYDPNADTLIDPALFCTQGETARDEAITCGEYLEWRFAKAFDYRKEDS